MSDVIVEGTQCECIYGQNKCALQVLNNMTNKADNKKIATTMDYTPGSCISGFGTCKSPANPAYVASQSTGSPPPPCVPAIVAPWDPAASKFRIKKIPALIAGSCVSCTLAAAPQSISLCSPERNGLTSQ